MQRHARVSGQAGANRVGVTEQVRMVAVGKNEVGYPKFFFGIAAAHVLGVAAAICALARKLKSLKKTLPRAIYLAWVLLV